MAVFFTLTGHAKQIKISNDLTLFYQEKGIGKTLLFILGFSMPPDVFKSQIDYFSKKHHIIAIDPRSQGRSSVT
jgi:non-heme chloroperoxidase